MIVPLNLVSVATPVSTIKNIRRVLALLTLGLAHFCALAYCEISAAFSDVFFPFRFSPAPEHALWQGLAEVLRLPLVTAGEAMHFGDSSLMLIVAILNSAVWAVGIYFLSRWLIMTINT
ncbi:MAG: hypothetical protein ABIJ61_11390 [bacterium]